MSYLCPLQHDMTLGVFHGSHQFEGNIIHSGCGGRICIPIGTFILFDSNLYHYGDQSKIVGGCPMYSIRSFSYLVEKNYIGTNTTNVCRLSYKYCCDKITYEH